MHKAPQISSFRQIGALILARLPALLPADPFAPSKFRRTLPELRDCALPRFIFNRSDSPQRLAARACAPDFSRAIACKVDLRINAWLLLFSEVELLALL